MLKTIQVVLHDGTTVTAKMENYDAAELSNKLNDQKVLMITAGDIIVNKNVVKYIAPVIEAAQ
jgi:small nuclear ribonucleoprotein (snRNP)-like protein